MDPATEGAENREGAGQNLSYTTIGRCLYSGTGEAAEDARRAGQNGVAATLVGAQLDYANAKRRRT